MSLEGIQQSQCSPSCHEPKTEPVEKVFSRSLERTVSPVKAKPRYTSVNDLLSGHHLREGKELGRGHFGTVSILNSTKDHTTYVLKKPIEPYKELNPNEFNGSLVSNQHVTKTLAGIVKNVETGEVEVHTSKSKLIEKPMTYVLQAAIYEYVPGETLSTFLENLEEDLTSHEIYDIATQITEGIAEFNAEQGVLNDLKPENVMHDQKTGVFKLIDFGESKIITGKGKHGVKGTQGFQAPEVCFGNEYDQMADAWSLGATLLAFLLANESPDYLFAPHSKQLTSKRKEELENDENASLTLTETMRLIKEFSEMDVSERKELIKIWIEDVELDTDELDKLISVIAELTCFDQASRLSTQKAFERLKAAKENHDTQTQEESNTPLLLKSTEITEESEESVTTNIPPLEYETIEPKTTPAAVLDEAEAVITETPRTLLTEIRELDSKEDSTSQRPVLMTSSVQESDRTDRSNNLEKEFKSKVELFPYELNSNSDNLQNKPKATNTDLLLLTTGYRTLKGWGQKEVPLKSPSKEKDYPSSVLLKKEKSKPTLVEVFTMDL